MTVLSFTVPALPIGQGAISGGGTHTDATGKVTRKRAYHSNGKNLKAWRAGVTRMARAAMARTGWTTVPKPGALELGVMFYLPRPKTVTRPFPTLGGKNAHDLDHYLRGIGDALTAAGVWEDDSQVVDYGRTGKRYCDQNHPTPCAVITVRVVTSEENAA